ncbi:hypothetical protein MKX01_018048 [Papaver californicum]|nr:hypothetical protein MKX01_018048 [Papaver californicum]
MVAFGKKLKDRQIQEWQGYYINYKLMKKKVKQYAQQIEVGAQHRRHVLKEFSRMLDKQQSLEQHEYLVQHPEISQISALREAYRAAGQDLLKLLFFVEVNAIGLRKILKKFDKRFHYKFTDYYVTTRANHSYSQLQQVFKHVHALIMQEEELPSAVDDHVDDENYAFMSLLLNLVNTFLYMVNTYIIVPTADVYSTSLGAAPTVCGVVIGVMAVAQVFSSVYFSAWSNKSYFRPLIFSSIVLFFGNTMYVLAFDLDSIAVLLIGRLLCGFGSARAVNRRYISDCVPLKIRMQASAGFVTASALGMACGPALAGLLQTNFKIYRITFNANTLPGWVMALAWLVYLVWLWISFKEPIRENEENITAEEANPGVGNGELESRLTERLLLTSEDKQQDEDDDDSEEPSEESRNPASSIREAYRLLTPSVKAQLLIYFMLKYAMEILLSESTTYYFSWPTSSVAIFLACLGITVLPVNIFVGSYISNMFEDRQILLASEIMVCIGILSSFHIISPYSVPQYVCSAFITFVFAEVLEGVNLALLSRVMSSMLAQAGTLARVIADATITLAGYLGQSSLLNVTLLPSLIICCNSIVATFYIFNYLY